MLAKWPMDIWGWIYVLRSYLSDKCAEPDTPPPSSQDMCPHFCREGEGTKYFVSVKPFCRSLNRSGMKNGKQIVFDNWLEFQPMECYEIWDFIHGNKAIIILQHKLHKLRQQYSQSKSSMLLYFSLLIVVLSNIVTLSEAKPNMFLVKTEHKDKDVQRFLAKTDTGKKASSGHPNI